MDPFMLQTGFRHSHTGIHVLDMFMTMHGISQHIGPTHDVKYQCAYILPGISFSNVDPKIASSPVDILPVAFKRLCHSTSLFCNDLSKSRKWQKSEVGPSYRLQEGSGSKTTEFIIVAKIYTWYTIYSLCSAAVNRKLSTVDDYIIQYTNFTMKSKGLDNRDQNCLYTWI